MHKWKWQRFITKLTQDYITACTPYYHVWYVYVLYLGVMTTTRGGAKSWNRGGGFIPIYEIGQKVWMYAIFFCFLSSSLYRCSNCLRIWLLCFFWSGSGFYFRRLRLQGAKTCGFGSRALLNGFMWVKMNVFFLVKYRNVAVVSQLILHDFLVPPTSS